jgi:hypothetical protein
MALASSPLPNTRVSTWDGHRGTVLYVTADGWVGVRIDGETTTWEYQGVQLESEDVASRRQRARRVTDKTQVMPVLTMAQVAGVA